MHPEITNSIYTTSNSSWKILETKIFVPIQPHANIILFDKKTTKKSIPYFDEGLTF
jgi:hypothetical protein